MRRWAYLASMVLRLPGESVALAAACCSRCRDCGCGCASGEEARTMSTSTESERSATMRNQMLSCDVKAPTDDALPARAQPVAAGGLLWVTRCHGDCSRHCASHSGSQVGEAQLWGGQPVMKPRAAMRRLKPCCC